MDFYFTCKFYYLVTYCNQVNLFIFSFSIYTKTKAFLVTSLLPSYLMEQKYYTTIYKNHHVQFRFNNKILYKFIVKAFTIYNLGKNTVIQWRIT